MSIIGDFEADYLFMELVFAFIYGLCYGFLLPIIQQKIEKISPLDIVFALNFLAFIAISISIPLLSSPAELSAVVATPGFYWKLATLVCYPANKPTQTDSLVCGSHFHKANRQTHVHKPLHSLTDLVFPIAGSCRESLSIGSFLPHLSLISRRLFSHSNSSMDSKNNPIRLPLSA